jgi:hypothetical protein
MKIFFLLDGEPSSVADQLMEAITVWVKSEETHVEIIDKRPEDMAAWELGIQLECKRRIHMKPSLDFLFKLAKKIEREFVIGLYDKRGARENICYFGYEEGCPDIDEVAMYLGLK